MVDRETLVLVVGAYNQSLIQFGISNTLEYNAFLIFFSYRIISLFKTEVTSCDVQFRIFNPRPMNKVHGLLHL